MLATARSTTAATCPRVTHRPGTSTRSRTSASITASTPRSLIDAVRSAMARTRTTSRSPRSRAARTAGNRVSSTSPRYISALAAPVDIESAVATSTATNSARTVKGTPSRASASTRRRHTRAARASFLAAAADSARPAALSSARAWSVELSNIRSILPVDPFCHKGLTGVTGYRRGRRDVRPRGPGAGILQAASRLPDRGTVGSWPRPVRARARR